MISDILLGTAAPGSGLLAANPALADAAAVILLAAGCVSLAAGLGLLLETPEARIHRFLLRH